MRGVVVGLWEFLHVKVLADVKNLQARFRSATLLSVTLLRLLSAVATLEQFYWGMLQPHYERDGRSNYYDLVRM